jgi:hypothetical protein
MFQGQRLQDIPQSCLDRLSDGYHLSLVRGWADEGNNVFMVGLFHLSWWPHHDFCSTLLLFWNLSHSRLSLSTVRTQGTVSISVILINVGHDWQKYIKLLKRRRRRCPLCPRWITVPCAPQLHRTRW